MACLLLIVTHQLESNKGTVVAVGASARFNGGRQKDFAQVEVYLWQTQLVLLFFDTKI